MKKVIVTKLSRAIRHVVSRGAQGPRGGLWAGWADIPDKPDFDALYDPLGAASSAQSASAEDATAKVNAHEGAVDPHAQYALDTDLSGHTGDMSNPHNVTKDQVGLGNVDNTSDASKPVSTAQQNALNGKEPTIAAGTSAQFWRGDKTWADFAANVRMTVLTGLSTASASVITAADSVLGAIGKLQAQISDVITQTEAEAGTSTTRRSWTAQRVRQATAAWWLTASSSLGRTLASIADAAAGRTALGLGSASVLAAGQADAALPTNTDIRSYYGARYRPGMMPTLELDFERSQFSRHIMSTGQTKRFNSWSDFATDLGADLSVTRAGEQTYYDSTGTLRVASANSLAIDYDPFTGACLGPSIWPAATNLCLQSNDFSNAAWTKTNGSITPSAGGGVNPTTPMSRHVPAAGVTMGTGTTLTRVLQNVTLSAGDSVFSIDAKADGYNRIGVTAIGTTSTSATVDLLTGAVVSGSATVKRLKDDIFRITIPVIMSTGGSCQLRWSALDSVDTVGDGVKGILASRAQVEAGTVDSPYIPTTSATVTRPATLATIGGTAFSELYNPSENTIVSRITSQLTAQPNTRYAWYIGDGTLSNYLARRLIPNSIAADVIGSAAGTAQMNSSDRTRLTTTSSSVVGQKRNDAVVIDDNGAFSQAVTPYTTVNATVLAIGGLPTSSQLSGNIGYLAIFPKKMSTANSMDLAK